MKWLYLVIPLLPLFAALAAGLFGRQLGRKLAHAVTTGCVGLAFLLSLVVFYHIVLQGAPSENITLYTWAVVGKIRLEVGFLIDALTVLMMLVVTFVSLMVHIYTIGYMHDDPGYQRFFSYISLFTFAMLMLVMSNNFLQLFFGWEGVGLVSYLLIGFWYQKESAIVANMKAFIVNRVGDMGLILGIAVIAVSVAQLESLQYVEVFNVVASGMDLSPIPGIHIPLFELVGLLLFIGAMGKSAQVPLHVWLPDSMEGPTPISALIHAATMVTAGIFLVARMSPIFEHAELVLNLILIIGSLTAFFMGLVGIVQNDIKRVVAYSTLSQLGYMTAALGASMYSGAMFHLMTHAFFKALLFLAAGSVIIAMHHEQDIRKMGGLRRYMPITYATALIGSLALIGFPGFSGFFSKDLILEAVYNANQPAAMFAYILLLLGVFVTAFYTFRMFFMVFHGDERMDDHTLHHLHESPWVVTIPLIMLAIPSVLSGFFIGSVGVGDFFGGALSYVPHPKTETVSTFDLLHEEYHGVWSFLGHGLLGLPVWLAFAGVGAAWYLYLKNDTLLDKLSSQFTWLSTILQNQYYFDKFYNNFFAKGALYLGSSFVTLGEKLLIDGLFVNGSAYVVSQCSLVMKKVQSGYLYHYAFAMILGIVLMATWFVSALW